MPNEFLHKVGGQIRFLVAGSFSPADAGTNMTIGTPTDVVLTLSAVANGAGRQSTKFDFGATRARAYELLGCVDFTGETPIEGNRVRYYFLPSTNATAANGNIAGNSGADGVAPDGAVGLTATTDIEIFARMAQYIGALTVHDGAVVQNGYVGVLVPTSRFGQLLMINNSGDAFEADDVEMHQVLDPIVDELQD